MPLIPVLIDSAPLPRPEDLPGDLPGILKYNAMRVRHDAFEEDVERLIEPLREARECAVSRPSNADLLC